MAIVVIRHEYTQPDETPHQTVWNKPHCRYGADRPILWIMMAIIRQSLTYGLYGKNVSTAQGAQHKHLHLGLSVRSDG